MLRINYFFELIIFFGCLSMGQAALAGEPFGLCELSVIKEKNLSQAEINTISKMGGKFNKLIINDAFHLVEISKVTMRDMLYISTGKKINQLLAQKSPLLAEQKVPLLASSDDQRVKMQIKFSKPFTYMIAEQLRECDSLTSEHSYHEYLERFISKANGFSVGDFILSSIVLINDIDRAKDIHVIFDRSRSIIIIAIHSDAYFPKAYIFEKETKDMPGLEGLVIFDSDNEYFAWLNKMENIVKLNSSL